MISEATPATSALEAVAAPPSAQTQPGKPTALNMAGCVAGAGDGGTQRRRATRLLQQLHALSVVHGMGGLHVCIWRPRFDEGFVPCFSLARVDSVEPGPDGAPECVFAVYAPERQTWDALAVHGMTQFRDMRR